QQHKTLPRLAGACGDFLLCRGQHDGRGPPKRLLTVEGARCSCTSQITDLPLLSTRYEPLSKQLISVLVSTSERRNLLADTPWAAFASIARAAASRDDVGVVASILEEISGFELLRSTLEDRFIKRSQLLRCFRVVNDARALVSQIRFQYLAQ